MPRRHEAEQTAYRLGRPVADDIIIETEGELMTANGQLRRLQRELRGLGDRGTSED